MSDHDAKIHYVELPAPDMAAMKAFYGEAFGWTFTDYGPTYAAFHGAGLDGGFDASGAVAPRAAGTNAQAAHGALVILYADDLPTLQARVEAAGGRIVTPAFDFPGGRRFHFADPCGNELGVWTERS